MSKFNRAIRGVACASLVAASAVAFSSAVHAAQLGAIKDAWLVMKVHSEMVDEDVLNGSDIDVDVDGGVVTLQGTVTSEAGRARALEVAKANDGVKSVVDQLRVAPAKPDGAVKKAGRSIDDGWIKSKIYAQYLADWNNVLDDSDIDVDVKDNMVTLSGTVKSADAKAKAVATAKNTDGVKGVHDNLRIGTR